MTDLEAAFDFQWRNAGGPALMPEHRFHPPRRWRFDRAHLASRVAVELEGGVYSGGRHTRGQGFEADCCKYNAATASGWAVFRLTGGMLADDPLGNLAPIIATIDARMNRATLPPVALAGKGE